jgi:hypothetical protein
MPAEFSEEEAARRRGADVFHPTPEVIGEINGVAPWPVTSPWC